MAPNHWRYPLPRNCNNSFTMSDRQPRHAVIILAAGASTRLGRPKQLISINGESLLNRTIRAAVKTQPAQTLLVLGHHADVIEASITHQGIERVDCADWTQG